MSVARLLDRRDTVEEALSATFGSFNRLKVSRDGVEYTSSFGEIQLGQTYNTDGTPSYIPALIRGVDAQLDANQTFAGRVSFFPQWNNLLKELCWIGSSDINTTLGPDSWGLFVRALSSPFSLDGKIGLTQKDPNATPPVLTGLSYLWNLQSAGFSDQLTLNAIDSRGGGTSAVLERISPIGATPSSQYSQVFNTYASFGVNSGQATILNGNATVQVAVPNITAASVVMLSWADNLDPAVVKLWPTVPVAGTLQINTTAAVAANTKVNWFVSRFV